MSDFALHGVSVVDFGAVGDGLYDCTGPVQRAFDEAAGDGGGGVVFFPPGVWRCGSLCLRSGITIVLRKGAVLQAAREAEKFPHFTHSVDSRMDLFPWRAFLFGVGLSDLCIRGEGTIECGGESPAFQDGIGDSPDRLYGLFLVDCRNVRLEGLRLRNSAHWMMRLLQCRDVRLQGLDIFNHCNRNNDGMDIDSCDGVLVSDCIIDSSDDALCLKSETTQACRNVLIRNCLLSSHASAIKFGTASIGGFINVVVSDCIIRPSRATTMHHPFDLPNGMTGIDIACVDGGGSSFTELSANFHGWCAKPHLY